MPICTATKTNGEQCQAWAQPGSELCLFHSPEMRDQCKAGRSAGGLKRARPKRPITTLPLSTPDVDLATPGEVARFLSQTLNHVRRGQLDARIGNALAVLASTLLRALQTDDLDKRMSLLEQKLGPNR